MRYFILIFGLISVNLCISQSVIKDKGKQGIIDNDGTIILPPIYDNVMSAPQYLSDFFLVKHNNKYAYVYKMTCSYEKVYKKKTFSLYPTKLANPQWVISDFEYDEFYPFFNFRDKEIAELHMKYKKDGLYGLIYLEAYPEDKSRIFTSLYYDKLGKMTVLPLIYNEIFPNEHFIFPVQKNNKFGFIFSDRNNYTDSLYVNNTEIKYDTLPELISYDRDVGTYTVGIRENKKYGLLEFNYNHYQPKIKIPCECRTEVQQMYILFNKVTSVFICKESDAYTMIVYDEENNQRFELPVLEKKGGAFYLLKAENGNKYIVIELRSTKENIEINKHQPYEDIYIIDVKNEKMKISFLGNENVSYENLTMDNMPLIMRSTKTENGFSFDFFDIETEQILFSLPPKKESYYYRIDMDFNNDKLLISHPLENGLRRSVGYYDYETKIYKKGKFRER